MGTIVRGEHRTNSARVSAGPSNLARNRRRTIGPFGDAYPLRRVAISSIEAHVFARARRLGVGARVVALAPHAGSQSLASAAAHVRRGAVRGSSRDAGSRRGIERASSVETAHLRGFARSVALREASGLRAFARPFVGARVTTIRIGPRSAARSGRCDRLLLGRWSERKGQSWAALSVHQARLSTRASGHAGHARPALGQRTGPVLLAVFGPEAILGRLGHATRMVPLEIEVTLAALFARRGLGAALLRVGVASPSAIARARGARAAEALLAARRLARAARARPERKAPLAPGAPGPSAARPEHREHEDEQEDHRADACATTDRAANRLGACGRVWRNERAHEGWICREKHGFLRSPRWNLPRPGRAATTDSKSNSY